LRAVLLKLIAGDGQAGRAGQIHWRSAHRRASAYFAILFLGIVEAAFSCSTMLVPTIPPFVEALFFAPLFSEL